MRPCPLTIKAVGTFTCRIVFPEFSMPTSRFSTLFMNYEDAAVEDHSATWDEEQRRGQLGRELLPGLDEILRDKSTLVRSSSPMALGGDKVLWKELAIRYRLSFHSELNPDSFRKAFPSGSWPRYLVGPDEGRLDADTCEALIEVLESFGDKQDCFLRLSDFWKTGEENAQRLFLGKLRDVTGFLYDPQFGLTPEYWWPMDRRWLVCTDWDLCFTLVGGSEELVTACLSNSGLECVRVSPTTRIDYRADEVNLPPQ